MLTCIDLSTVTSVQYLGTVRSTHTHMCAIARRLVVYSSTVEGLDRGIEGP